jgi:hypothetical protein
MWKTARSSLPLDPAIHAARPNALRSLNPLAPHRVSMDARVKPAHDE